MDLSGNAISFLSLLISNPCIIIVCAFVISTMGHIPDRFWKPVRYKKAHFMTVLSIVLVAIKNIAFKSRILNHV
jgi:hypothetical protein